MLSYMAQVYTLPSPHGHPYYEASQLAAFAVYVALLLAQGQRRGYPWRNWLPLVATSTLALIVGCQLVALPPGEWLGWLRGDAASLAAVAGGPRSIIGGATASLLAVLAVRRVLGFRGWGVFDAFGAPLCWALAVQCVGCLLVGCCWGEVTTGQGFALVYGPGTLPYLMQQAQGVLPKGAAHSLPLVPTQFYTLLLCASAGLVLHLVRRQAGWPPGSRYLLALMLLMLTRSIIDFWRDPTSEPLGGAGLTLAGCTLLQVQWLMLPGAGLLLGGWAWLVRRPSEVPTPFIVAEAGHPALVALGLLVATARLSAATLNAPEVLVLQALLLAVLLAEGQALLANLNRQNPSLIAMPLGLAVGGVLLLVTAQAPAPQHAHDPAPADERTPTSTLVFSGGGLGSYHDADEDILNYSGGCSGSTRYNLYQRVRAAGGEVALERTGTSKAGSDLTSTIGGGLWLGTQNVGLHRPLVYGAPFTVHPDTTLAYRLTDVHIYLEQHRMHNWLSVGYRLGLHIGDLGHYSYFDQSNTTEANQLIPELMLSLGNARVLYAQADAGYGAENALGVYTSRVGLGSGLGQLNGSKLLVGYAHSPHYPSPSLAFISASLRAPSGTGLSALSLEPYFATDFARHNIFSLKASYRLGK